VDGQSPIVCRPVPLMRVMSPAASRTGVAPAPSSHAIPANAMGGVQKFVPARRIAAGELRELP
jgi:hypothetical protein